jgi:hypothetical protein
MTDSLETDAPRRPRRRRLGLRFAIAFLAGLLAAMALGVGALYGYDQQYEGRVLPGVRVGAVDLSGLTADGARQRIESSYSRLASGSLVLRAGDRQTSIPWSELGRRIDTEALVADAMRVGRSDNPVERVIGNAKTAIRGVSIEPRIVFDPEAVADRVEAFARTLDASPTDAAVTIDAKGVTLVEGTDGAVADRRAPIENALAALSRTDTPLDLDVEVPITPVEPNVTNAEATEAKQRAEQIARDLVITVDDDESFPIRASTIRTWLRIAPTVDGGLTPVLDVTKVAPVLDPMAEAIRKVARNASFTLDGETIDAPAGTVVFLPEGDVLRVAISEEEGTTVLAVGGWPDKAFEPSVWEWFFEAYAQPPEEGIATIEDGLREKGEQPALLYHLACLEARTGRLADARGHLARAVELRPELAERAREDDDLKDVV